MSNLAVTRPQHYHYDNDYPLPLEEVLSRWVEFRDKPETHSFVANYPVYTLDEVWPLREFDRPLDCGLVQSLEQYGWRPEQPATLSLGSNGTMVLTEGNHRLAGARWLGMNAVPLKFLFVGEVEPGKALIPDYVSWVAWITKNRINVNKRASRPEFTAPQVDNYNRDNYVKVFRKPMSANPDVFAIVGVAGEREDVLSYRFPKDTWTRESARKWCEGQHVRAHVTEYQVKKRMH